MKKYFYLAALALTATAFTACSSDSELAPEEGYGYIELVSVTTDATVETRAEQTESELSKWTAVVKNSSNAEAFNGAASTLAAHAFTEGTYSLEVYNYANDAAELQRLSREVTDYAHGHKLMHLPNIIKVFFKYEPDHEIERISEEMEAVIEDLSNTRDKLILTEINHYPILSVKAHTRPFEHRWMNIAAFILLPIGIFLYIRMWSFRLRLLRDLRTIKQTNTNIVNRINEVYINKV